MNRVLICISDAELFLFLRHMLDYEGLQAVAAPERQDLCEQPELSSFRAIVFEWNGGKTSRENIAFAKATAPNVPLIILSRQDQTPAEMARQKDLVLTRPFDPVKLISFVRKICHDAPASRRTVVMRSTLRFAGIELNPDTMQATRNGKQLELTSLQFRLLGHLMTRGANVCDRDELITTCWSRPKDVEPRTVDIHIGHLRKVLMRDGPDIIRTIRGQGYALKKPQA